MHSTKFRVREPLIKALPNRREGFRCELQEFNMLLPSGTDRYIYMSEETGDNADIGTLRDNMATDLGLINALQRDFKDTVRSWEWCRDRRKIIIILEQTTFVMQLLFEFTDELE